MYLPKQPFPVKLLLLSNYYTSEGHDISVICFLWWIHFIMLGNAFGGRLNYHCFVFIGFAAGADFSLRNLGFGEGLPSHVATYRTDLGMPHRDYSVSVGSDADTETDGIMSPEHAVRLWGRSNTKSGRSSCLSSRANSNLTLTDTEHENTENGKALFPFRFSPCQSLSDKLILHHVFPWRFWRVWCWNGTDVFIFLSMVFHTEAEWCAMSLRQQKIQATGDLTAWQSLRLSTDMLF